MLFVSVALTVMLANCPWLINLGVILSADVDGLIKSCVIKKVVVLWLVFPAVSFAMIVRLYVPIRFVSV